MIHLDRGSVPGQGNEWGFWIVAVPLVILGAVMLSMLRSRRLF